MNQSSEIKDLVTALVQVQKVLTGAKKDSENPFFKSKFADLESVWDSIRIPLTQNGLCIIQTSEYREGQTGIVTTLAHTSGQWIQGFYPLNPVKNDPQSLGSATTYARRYALSAIVGVVQVDDDGQAASHQRVAPEQPPASMPTVHNSNSWHSGQWNKKSFEQIEREEGLERGDGYCDYLEQNSAKNKKLLTQIQLADISAWRAYSESQRMFYANNEPGASG